MSVPTFPKSILYYVPFTITNSEATATPSPFQQYVEVNPSLYSAYLASNLSNVQWFDASGNIIDSWLESGNSSTATSAVYWLSITNGILANSSITVYMGLGATTSNFFNNTTTGEAPQLSGTYGEYDNGATVFPFYDNFTGTTLSSGWTAFGSFSGNTNNGETIESSHAWSGIYHALPASIFANLTADYYGKLVTTQAFDIELAQATTQNGMLESGYGFHITGGSGTTADIIEWTTTTPTIASGTLSYTGTFYTGSIQELSPSTVNALVNESILMTASNSSFQGAYYIALGGYIGINFFVQYVRVRFTPPAGVMPSQTAGSLAKVSSVIVPPVVKTLRYNVAEIMNKLILP